MLQNQTNIDEYIHGFCCRFGVPEISISFDFENFKFNKNYAEFGATSNEDGNYFMLASMSKALTLLCVHKLSKRGSIDLSVPIGEVLPWLRGDRIAETRSTLDFLNHTSGMDHTVYQWRGLAEQTAEGWLRLNYDDIVFSKPHGGYSYSNFNYQICGAIIENLTGLGVSQAINDILFSGEMIVFSHKDLGADVAQPNILEQGQQLSITMPRFVSHYDASSTLFSKVGLLTKALKRLVYYDNDFEDLFDLCDTFLQDSGVSYCPDYGYGLFRGRRGRLFEEASYGHGGKELGYNTLLFFSPSQKGVASILSNSHHVNIIELALTVYNELNGAPRNGKIFGR